MLLNKLPSPTEEYTVYCVTSILMHVLVEHKMQTKQGPAYQNIAPWRHCYSKTLHGAFKFLKVTQAAGEASLQSVKLYQFSYTEL